MFMTTFFLQVFTDFSFPLENIFKTTKKIFKHKFSYLKKKPDFDEP